MYPRNRPFCDMLRIPHCLEDRLTNGGKVVSSEHRPHFTPQKHISVCGTHFYWKLSEPQGLVRPEGLGKLKKIISPRRVSNPRPSSL
jgi:hypothetical protein